MTKVFLLLLLSTTLFATDLIKYNIYKSPQKIDLMLTFNTPYPGKISKSATSESTILALEGVNFSQKKITKKIDSSLLESLTIASMKDKILIELKPKEKITVEASKTIDSTGLRIRIEKKAQNDLLTPIAQKRDYPLKEYDFGASFLKILLALGILIAVLWVLKKWLDKKSSGWLFGEQNNEQKIKIISQRAIDMKNRVVLIGFEDKKYLVILGENNLLLDSFNDDEAFESLLQKNDKKLGDYLKNR